MPDVSEVITSGVFPHPNSANSSDTGDDDIKHICPHRKQGILTTKGLQNGDLHSKDECEFSPHSKGHHGDETGKIKSKPGSRGRRSSSEIKAAKAKKVQDKGNGQSRWSAKQIPKTMAIRHPDNLKSEGTFNLTTTHQHDYTEKAIEIDPSRKIHLSSERKESWSKRQIPKTLPIRKEDNLKPSGSLDLKTTHGEAYTSLTPVEASPRGEQDEEVLNGVRKIKKSPKQQRPKTSLRPEGHFQSETLYQKDFSPRKQPPTPKHRPPSHLKPEGQMYFEQTSSDYKADIFQVRTEDGQIISPRSRNIRPQNNLKASSVPIEVQTTNSDYKIWNVERPPRRRPEDMLKRIPGPESIDERELLEQIKSDIHDQDYSVWNVNRPIVQKPTSTLKAEGDIEFETTHHADYIVREQRDEIHDEVDQTLVSTPPEEVTSEERCSPQDIQAEETAVSPTSELTKLKSEISSTDEARESVEVVDTTKKDEEIASSEGGSSDQMLTWEDIRAQPVRPRSNLRQDGGMTFDTTNRREFIQRPIERVKGFRPQTSTKISGEMETTTTNQVMLRGDVGERVNPIRPKSNLHIEEGTFNDETTSAREFKEWALDKPKPILHKSTLAQEGEMTFTTTHHTEFEPKSPEKVYPIRPHTTNKVYDTHGKFDGTTTSSVMHPKYENEKVVDSIRPESNLKPNSGLFNGETTNRREFQEWAFDRMSPFRPSTNMRQEGDMDFTTMNQVQFRDNLLPQERVHPVIHPTNLHMETGRFSDDVTSRREFQEWKVAKPTPFSPKGNLTQEGTMDFTTVNQTQFFEKPINREIAQKPKSSSKLTGDFNGTTTNQTAFQNIPGEKSQELRPKTNIRLEDGEFSTETTAKTEYQPWELNKREPIKPKSSVRYEGDFDNTTTNRETYKSHPYQRERETRPHTNLHLESGAFENETTNQREFHKMQYSKSNPMLPHGNLAQEGDMDFTTSNQTEFGEKAIERVDDVRPHTTAITTGQFDGTTTNRSMFKTPPLEKIEQIRHEDNLKVSSGLFNGETTARREFGYKSSDRPEPVRPKPNLAQEGNFDFKTSNQRDFEAKPMTKVFPIRPQTKTRLSDGDFYGTTTNQAMFGTSTLKPVKPIVPQPNLKPSDGEFYDNTTAREQYQPWTVERPAPIIYSDNLKQEGSMQFETTNRTEFVERTTERPEVIRPQTTTKIEGDIDTTTTNQAMYSGRLSEKVHPIRQKDNLYIETGKFSGETTNRREFRQWIKAHPRTKAVKPLRAAGIRTQGSFDRTYTKEASSNVTDGKISSDQGNGVNQQSHISKESYAESEISEKSAKAQENADVRETTQDQQSKDYGSKPVARVKAIAPVENIKQGGTMNFSTTTGTEFTEKLEQSKVENMKIRTDHEPWRLAQDDIDEANRYAKQKVEIPTRPVIHKRATIAEIDIAIAETREYNASVFKAPKRYRPSDNLKTENVPFDGDSTTRTEYKKWDAMRSSSKKRSPMLKQEGEMQFSTTADDYSRDFFDQNGRLKPRSKKPQENLKLVGDMNLSTTTQTSYVGNITPKTKNLRPKSTLKLGSDPDSSTGTPPSSVRKHVELTTDVTKSTNLGNYSERTRAHRPTTSQKVGEGRFEGVTTTQSEFKAMPALDKTKSFKPESSHVFDGSSKFQGNTTYRCTYEAAQNRRCPALDLESDKYQFKEEVNGHRFYLPLVQG